MPPLLGARTCWRAGWVVFGLGMVLIVVSDSVASAVFNGRGPEALAQILFTALNVVAYMTPLGGIVLLIGSVVVRHVERLTDALVASGTIEALPAPPHGAQRTLDGDVDLDDLREYLDDVAEHEPWVR